MENVLSALSDRHEFSWTVEEHHILRHGTASGTLLGGNLTCLCHLLGTPYFPDLSGALLLLEDRGEAVYRLDRLFTQLKLAGVFDQIRGLILGRFHDCDDPRKIRDMVQDQVKCYSFPVVADLPFGHDAPNQVIPLGASFVLNTYEGTFRMISDFGWRISELQEPDGWRISDGGCMISEAEDLLPLTMLPSALCLPKAFSPRWKRCFAQALTAKTFSGASLLVANPSVVLFHKTWGYTHHGGSPIDRHTLFDLASLTKPLITAPLCMRAVSEGKFALDDRLQLLLPCRSSDTATSGDHDQTIVESLLGTSRLRTVLS